jgi:hypothetical protein
MSATYDILRNLAVDVAKRMLQAASFKYRFDAEPIFKLL